MNCGGGDEHSWGGGGGGGGRRRVLACCLEKIVQLVPCVGVLLIVGDTGERRGQGILLKAKRERERHSISKSENQQLPIK